MRFDVTSSFRPADLAVGLGTLALLCLIAKVGSESFVRFHPPDVIPQISLDPRNLPNYAARSTLRMFIALVASTLFTFAYGYAAARSAKAERVLIPLLDILQSVPVLGFLSVTVTAFIALFRGSLLGLEAASIFAIFTGQAWNMTFSFYQSLRTVPHEMEEMASLYHLSAWERFTRLELPVSAIGLVWNGMMSFGGGWFFLAASESISVLNHQYTLPGIGSYVAAAVAAKDMHALAWAIVTMILLILLIDQLFWKPLVTMADRYKVELSAGEERRFWVVDLWRGSSLPKMVNAAISPIWHAVDRWLSARTAAPEVVYVKPASRRGDIAFNVTTIFFSLVLVATAIRFVWNAVGVHEMLHAAVLGLATAIRVLFLIAFSTLVWTPIGVAIGLSPRLARLTQPLVQIAASFPANFLFPFATLAFIKLGISLNWGSILLMSLGSQWYMLFNVIGGAQAIPNDLREMATSLGLRGWQKWRYLLGPGIFGTWVTGAVTASGGAWNASIVSELVSWGDTTLKASGLGAYIADATGKGDWPRIVLGVGLMSVFVVSLNRLVWRPLYGLAQRRYQIG
ncbi:ABC transporter permease [Silvibacterium dinghuense]|uniref:ABC transporter permease subunit n=1 Tax=Silvibacterium dinghuense TaxID=1560006 RepID=A0A4Q1SJ51_9BACT|nr:ABC transporter permease subunit [Silvibacterium dinghuense]RXS97661.1 ABC transporter permease subunit [Silvibacterium dinghuense]GGH00919.1 ABC transporter permease [Silvibacterium dinghuense]